MQVQLLSPALQASSIVDHALAYARAHDLAPMTIAALDARGCIVALTMEDGSGLLWPDIAAGKAWGLSAWGSEPATSPAAPNPCRSFKPRSSLAAAPQGVPDGSAEQLAQLLRGAISRPGFARSRLYSTTMRRALSNCRLYSWIRLTWQSKMLCGLLGAAQYAHKSG